MKLTSTMLKKIIAEEAAKLSTTELKDEAGDETDADEYADSVEKQVDFLKALKIEEAKHVKRIKEIREERAQTMTKLFGKI
jgi:hypothetical protein